MPVPSVRYTRVNSGVGYSWPKAEFCSHAKRRILPRPSRLEIGTLRGKGLLPCLVPNAAASFFFGDRYGAWQSSLCVLSALYP